MKKKRGKKFKAAVGGIAVVILAAGVFVGVRTLHAQKTPSEGTVKQSTTALAKMDLTDSISASGIIESQKSRSVSAEVNDGEIAKVYVKVGDEVKKGDKLAVFDTESLESSLSDAEDSLSEARTSAASEVSLAQEQYDSAVSDQNYNNTKASKSLQKALNTRNTASKTLAAARKKVKNLKSSTNGKNSQELTAAQETLDKAKEAYEQAKAAVETAKDNKTDTARQAKSSVSQAKTSLENARSNQTKSIKEAQKQVDEAQKAVEKCIVTAPIDGVVTALNAAVGDTYTGGTIAEIEDDSRYTITTSVDEYDISDVKKGQRVVVLTEATDEDELEGVVTFVAPSTGSSSATDTSGGSDNTAGSSSGSDGYEVKIRLKTKDVRLKMGMTAKCSIIKDEADDVFAVPYDAVSKAQDGSYYITVMESNARTDNNDTYYNRKKDSSENKNSGQSGTRRITVTKGMETDYYTEISGDDLQEGLEVVIPTDKVSSGSDSSQNKNSSGFGDMGNMGGGAPDGGNMGGKGGFGGGPGGGR